LIVAWYLAALKAGLAGGVPTLRAGVPFGAYVQCVAGSAASDGVAEAVGVGTVVGEAVGVGVDVAAAAGLPLPPLSTR
jgi:hypothetical protein